MDNANIQGGVAMADKGSSDNGSSTSAAKSLNEQNWPGLLAITGLNIIAFAVVIGAVGPDPVQFSKLAAAWAVVLPAGVGLAMIRVLNGLISGKYKDRLVFFWNWQYPLPGFRAYTVYAKNDYRFTQDDVKNKLFAGPNEHEYKKITKNPKEQNAHWYKNVYHPMRDKPSVRQAELNFLFTRDCAAISFVMLFALGAAGYIVIKSTATWELYCGGLILQYLLVVLAARNYGIDTVTNAIAERLNNPAASDTGAHGAEQTESLIAVLEFANREPQ
jgi:hypothetical protein